MPRNLTLFHDLLRSFKLAKRMFPMFGHGCESPGGGDVSPNKPAHGPDVH